MSEIDARIERAKKEISGNESLFDMLDGESVAEMFNWGAELAASLAKSTEGMDDDTADTTLAPRLKSLRQALRTVGNWAAGKYTEPADLVTLKDKLAENFRQVLGESSVVTPEGVGEVLESIVAEDASPKELIIKMKSLIEKPGQAAP